jgi:hypothetical protein
VSVLQTKQPQTITVDLRKKTVYQMPRFIQHDTNILEIIIKDNGVDADLNNIGKIVVNYERPDKKIISRFLIKNESNKIEYKLGLEENEFAGLAEIQIQFFSIDNQERISTTRFDVLLSASIGTDKIYENNGELSLLQELFVEVESIKQSAENEDARIENESQRQDAEAERNTKEIERQLAETSRIEAESTRLTSEQTRETNEAIRQQQEAARQNNTAQIISEAQQAILNTEIVTQYATESGEYAVGKGNEAQALGLYAKQQGDRAQQIVDENKTIWLKPVATFAAIATTYPNPVFGSKVITMDDQKEYRFTTIWEWTGIYSSNGVTALQAQLADANRQSQVLTHGTSIFASALNSPVEFEVQGRTLISLGNSNLEGNKMYVLADKKTWIRAEGKEGTLIKGVSKFTKSASLISKADFAGKVAGSVLENAHIAKYAISPTLQAPSAFTSELSTLGYGRLNTLNGTSEVLSNSTNGNIVQMLFSKNVIEHIERKHGRIPSDTVAGKVQWLKDNVQRLTANWHGWGSSVGGNGVSFAPWNAVTTVWGTVTSHTQGTVTKLSLAIANIANVCDVNGFVHYLAYTTQPSDGTTPSQLNTDFIELEIELKSTAVLDTRPIISRVATFEGKINGSTVENPHVFKHGNSAGSLKIPSSFTSEPNDADKISSLNGVIRVSSTNVNGEMMQQLFSWNLIEEVERNIGRIPKATVAEKRQWIIENVDRFNADWNGFGSSPLGNKATVKCFNNNSGNWSNETIHNSASVAKINNVILNSYGLNNFVDSNGFIHYLAYAEPSDGVTPSTINTDFISLDITLKQGATLHDPVLPLFEVDASDYANILVSWDENAVQSRFPKVQGVQHLQNVAVIAEGENLLPSFSEWNLNANATIKTPYEFELNATAQYQQSWYEFSCLGGQTYHFSIPNLQSGMVWWYDTYDASGAKIVNSPSFSLTNRVINTESHARKLRITLSSSSPVVLGKFTFTNPMLTLGNTPKPFVPRNPSYLFAPVKLGQIGDKKDSLFKQDGQWQLVERVRKEADLDSFIYVDDFVGYKRIRRAQTTYGMITNDNSSARMVKYNGQLLRAGSVVPSGADEISLSSGYVYITLSDIDTGLGETYNPTPEDIKAYFNGWQAKTTDGNGKPTSWRSLGDGTDAPTQTLAYVSTNKAPNFTPYKLSYVLASPQTVNVNHLVEGDIAVSGQTQVEVTSGVVVREKVVPKNDSVDVYIGVDGAKYGGGKSELKNKNNKIYSVFKNGLIDQTWNIRDASNAYGKQIASIKATNYDPTAIYEVSYLVLDRHLQTVNTTEVKTSYSGNFKEVVDDTVVKVSDLAMQQSVLANQMYRVLVAAKGAGWNV